MKKSNKLLVNSTLYKNIKAHLVTYKLFIIIILLLNIFIILLFYFIFIDIITFLIINYNY